MPDVERERESEEVVDANQRIAESERPAGGDQLGDAANEVTRANEQISRGGDKEPDPLRRDAATLNPPD